MADLQYYEQRGKMLTYRLQDIIEDNIDTRSPEEVAESIIKGAGLTIIG